MLLSIFSFSYSANLTNLLCFTRYQIIETYRRLTLTAVVSVIRTGSSLQIIISCFATFFFLLMYTYVQPYRTEKMNIIAEVGMVQTFLTFYSAIIIYYQIFGNISYYRFLYLFDLYLKKKK